MKIFKKIFFVVFFFVAHISNGQPLTNKVNIWKVYPFSAMVDEFRIDLETQVKNSKSIEYGIGYLYRTIEKYDCKECYYFIPGYFNALNGKGFRLRVNWNKYLDSTRNLTGLYTSLGLIYKFIHLDKSSNVQLPFTDQHALTVQALVGKQFIHRSFVSNIYGGIGITGQLNILGDDLNKKQGIYTTANIYLGLAFGYKYQSKIN